MTEWRSVHDERNLTFQPEALHHKLIRFNKTLTRGDNPRDSALVTE